MPDLTALCRFCSIMFYFLLAILLLHITYENCDISITPPLEFTCLSKADNNFTSIRHHSHVISNSLAYNPLHHCPEKFTFFTLNQCYHSFLGCMTHLCFIGPKTQYSFIGLMTQHSFIGPRTQCSFIGFSTQQSFIDPVTQCSFIAPMNRHNHNKTKTGHMTQIPEVADAFTYQSAYNLESLPYTLLHSFSHWENQHIQFCEKRKIQILDRCLIKFDFHSISFADMSRFLCSIQALFLHKLIIFHHDWNINCNIYIFVWSSQDVNFLIALILLKLRRYITRRHDFVCYWRFLLFHDLLKSQCMFCWVLMALFRLMCIFFINQVKFLINWFNFFYNVIVNLLIYMCITIQNLFTHVWKSYVVILKIDIKKKLRISLLLLHFCEWAYFMTFYVPKIFLCNTSGVEIEHAFIGGGSLPRLDFKMLEPYVISINLPVQNPEQFNYVYDGHGSFKNISGDSAVLC